MIRLTRAQVREIDKRAIERYHIPGIVLMENAAREVADHAWRMYGHPDHAVLILCGGGNNGGDGLAVARHLHNHGASVTIVLAADPAQYQGDALTNWNIVRAMNLKLCSLDDAKKLVDGRGIDLIVDGIFGTGLTRPPREPFGQFVELTESAGVPVIAIDLPSGMDCDTGKPLGACIRATHTVTFVAEKSGFANPDSKQYTGEVIVGNIGAPCELIDEVLREIPS
jgi:NAD(P)H-hydrate epimerase